MKNDLDKFVIAALIYIAIWSVLFFISWCIFKTEPNTLEACILAPGVIELMCTSYIKTHKKIDSNETEEFHE